MNFKCVLTEGGRRNLLRHTFSARKYQIEACEGKKEREFVNDVKDVLSCNDYSIDSVVQFAC
jgi:hypothetical protein